MSSANILGNIRRYYSGKIEAHGPTARGVDWNSNDSQNLRFIQLLKVVDCSQPFTINDYGCGYGALVDHLRQLDCAFRYRGFDISPDMIAQAMELHAATDQVAFVGEEAGLSPADYTVASGVFNVKLETPAIEWENYVLDALKTIDGLSRRGFAFNVLTNYSDTEFMRPTLYYADPSFLFDYCKTHFSRSVALLHDYPLYEFTILVRKP